MDPARYLVLMAICYVLTVAIEVPILWVGLSRRHPRPRRLGVGLWLTACTYPIVWLVLPPLFRDRFWYLFTAETFAPAAEVLLFWWAYGAGAEQCRLSLLRDFSAIVVANLLSFALGELIGVVGGWNWLMTRMGP